MIVVIEYGPGYASSAMRFADYARRLGYRVVTRRRERARIRITTPAGVFYDADRASVAIAILKCVREVYR